MTHPIHSADADVITASGDRINWTRNGALVVERTFFGAEKVLFDRLAAEKRKSLELQRVYDERGLQIGRLETAMERLRAAAQVGANGAADIDTPEFDAVLTNFYTTAYSFAGSTPNPVTREKLVAFINAWGNHLAAGAQVLPLGYFSKNGGSAYHECDPKYKNESDVIPLFRAAGAPAETPKPADNSEVHFVRDYKSDAWREVSAADAAALGTNPVFVVTTLYRATPAATMGAPSLSDKQLQILIEAVGQARNQQLSPTGTMLLVRRTLDATIGAIGAGEGKGLALLDELRALGLTVAVHNDYRLNGEAHTFWLMIGPDGMSYKGEGKTDQEALTHVTLAAAMRSKTSPGEAG